jgi:hypothetical protein
MVHVPGNCGNGPSMVVLPEALMLRHVNTPKDVADILAWQCKVDIPEALLRATEVSTRAFTTAHSCSSCQVCMEPAAGGWRGAAVWYCVRRCRHTVALAVALANSSGAALAAWLQKPLSCAVDASESD